MTTMINHHMIPKEVANRILECFNTRSDDTVTAMRHAMAAGLKVWPQAKRVTEYFTHDTDHYEPAIILPLPQEVSDG